jgi:hypothetical protein
MKYLLVMKNTLCHPYIKIIEKSEDRIFIVGLYNRKE